MNKCQLLEPSRGIEIEIIGQSNLHLIRHLVLLVFICFSSVIAMAIRNFMVCVILKILGFGAILHILFRLFMINVKRMLHLVALPYPMHFVFAHISLV